MWKLEIFLIVTIAALIAANVAFAAVQDAPAPGAPVTWQPSKPIYTLTQAVDTALKNFPSISYARDRTMQEGHGITLAKTAYLPSLDLLFQELRGTTNNIVGLIFPQPLDVIPMQTGSATHSSSFSSIWANNQGANFSWLVVDFGLRHAGVLLARANHDRASAAEKLTELDVAAAAAEQYLQTVAAEQVIRAQRATVDRMEAWALVVHTLVGKGLKPGVDTSRADADVAFAKIALIDAERDTELARVNLAEAIGVAGTYISVIPAPFLTAATAKFAFAPVDLATHPLAILRAAQVKTAAAQVHVIDRTYYPHVHFHSGMWGRGSGSITDNRRVAAGIIPQTGNWAAGFSLTFPTFDYFAVEARRKIALKDQAAEKASYDLAMQELIQKDARAKVLYDSAKKVAEETPYLITAARENEKKALARYKVGLTNIIEVAESEEILAKAEVENAVAQVRVWRAMLATAYAQGDLKPFLNLASQAEGKRKWES